MTTITTNTSTSGLRRGQFRARLPGSVIDVRLAGLAVGGRNPCAPGCAHLGADAGRDRADFRHRYAQERAVHLPVIARRARHAQRVRLQIATSSDETAFTASSACSGAAAGTLTTWRYRRAGASAAAAVEPIRRRLGEPPSAPALSVTLVAPVLTSPSTPATTRWPALRRPSMSATRNPGIAATVLQGTDGAHSGAVVVPDWGRQYHSGSPRRAPAKRAGRR